MSIPSTPSPSVTLSQGYGVKAIRQLRNTHSSLSPSLSSKPHSSLSSKPHSLHIPRPNLKRQEVIEKTYDYFLREVDPIVGDCVTYLLCSQPANVPLVMLEYFSQRKKGIKLVPGAKEKGKERPEKEKTSKSQRLFLATQISPVLTKIVNRLATHKPKDVLGFICTELENIIQSIEHEDDRINSGPGSKGKPSHSVPTHQIHQGPKNIQIVVLGNVSSGKTSFINALQGKFDSNVRPTIGFRPTNMMLGTDQIKFYDLGGGVKIRGIWPEYFHDVHGVIYVIDASIKDGEMFQDSLQLFQDTLSHPTLSNKPLLIIANKQDIPGAMTSNELRQRYSLDNLTTIASLHLAETCTACLNSSSSDGPEVIEQEADPRIESSIEWILNEIQSHYVLLNERVENDTKLKQIEETKKRLQRERKVLKTKILCAFPHQVTSDLLTADHPTQPEDVFEKEQGETFLAHEIGEERESLPFIALEIAEMIGYQRLALQMIGALKAPITKKKQPMSWEDIRSLVIELRKELGLSVPSN